MHLLAAHAVAERDLALEDEDAHSVLGQPFCKRGTGEAAADRDHIVSFSHGAIPGRGGIMYDGTDCRASGPSQTAQVAACG